MAAVAAVAAAAAAIMRHAAVVDASASALVVVHVPADAARVACISIPPPAPARASPPYLAELATLQREFVQGSVVCLTHIFDNTRSLSRDTALRLPEGQASIILLRPTHLQILTSHSVDLDRW